MMLPPEVWLVREYFWRREQLPLNALPGHDYGAALRRNEDLWRAICERGAAAFEVSHGSHG